MTEKRYFKEDFYNEYAIKKEDTIIAIVDSGSNARRICDELNALHEENEQLKESVYSWSHSYNRVYEEKEQLRKELRNLRRLANEIYMEGSE